MQPTDFTNPTAAISGDAAQLSSDQHPLPDDARLDLIAKVHTGVVDTISGFDKMVAKAEPSFHAVAQDFLTMHSRHAGVLAAYLAQSGRQPDDNGSFFGLVNRAVIEVRSWFDEIDADVMDRVSAGEKQILDLYAEARDAGQTIEAHALLSDQMAEITAALHRHSS